MDFSQWTREDYMAFELRKAEVMKPTQTELDSKKAQELTNTKNAINIKLSLLWITRPEVITKTFVIWMLTQMKAEQFIGKNFSEWVDNQIILFGDIETAFDDLVSRFL